MNLYVNYLECATQKNVLLGTLLYWYLINSRAYFRVACFDFMADFTKSTDTGLPFYYCTSNERCHDEDLPSFDDCPEYAKETHTLCVFYGLPVVSWRRAKYKQMYGLKSTLTVSR